VALAATGLAACGFRPLYGPRGGQSGVVQNKLAAVYVGRIDERVGQLVRNALEQRLERTSGHVPKVYALDVNVTETLQSVGLRKDKTTTRANVWLRAEYVLSKGDTKLLTGDAETYAAYNILRDGQYATVVSERDARARAAETIAEDIVRRLSVYFAGEETGRTGEIEPS